MSQAQTQPSNSHQFTEQYRAELTLTEPRCVVSITGAHPADVQNTIQNLLKGKTTFDTVTGQTILVYNENHLDGEKPIGWIASFQVPAPMGVQAMADHRLQLVQKAA